MTRVCVCCKYHMGKASLSDISFFKFPKSDKLLKRWLLILGTEKKITRTSRICSRHFKENDFRYSIVGKRYLKPDVIPSLCLNEESRDDTVSNNQNTIVKENHLTNTMIEYSASENKGLDTVELCIETKKDNRLSERILFASADLNEPEKKCKKYLYDVRWEEISTSSVQAKIYWEVVIKKIKRQKVILKTLRQKVRRLEKQILYLQTLVKNKAITDSDTDQ